MDLATLSTKDAASFFLSHGPIIGTVVRIVYLLVWLGAFELAAIVLGAIAFQLAGMTSSWQLLVQNWLDATAAFVGRSLQKILPSGLPWL